MDTSRTINSWGLKHHFTRFEEVRIDTNTAQLQRGYLPVYKEGFAYEFPGMVGQGVNHLDFFLRPGNETFLFGRPWEPYLKKPDRTTFFNTKVPFTSLAYSMKFPPGTREESVEALHTQNLSPFTNFGLEFSLLSGQQFYDHERSKLARSGLFLSHNKEKYSLFGTLYYNHVNLEENGGLANLPYFLTGAADNEFDYIMRLDSSSSEYKNLSFFATQKYNLTEKTTSVDSAGQVTSRGKTLSLSHQLYLERNVRAYYGEDSVQGGEPFYQDRYYEILTPMDSVSEDRISNVFQVILGDPDYDKLSIRAYGGYEIRRFGQLSPVPVSVFSHVDTLSTDPLTLADVYRDSATAEFSSRWYHDLFVGFNLAGPTTGVWDWVVNGKYYLSGYYQNDFQADATFSRRLFGQMDLGLRGSIESRKPHYFANHYSSSYFHWENDFAPSYQIKGEAFLDSDSLDMEVRVGLSTMANYLYWDTLALPRVFDRQLMLVSLYGSKHFKVGGFHSLNKLLFQVSNAPEILNLPLAALYTSNYWNQSLFKGALVFDLGFDLSYTTPYLASAYMPVTGVYHLQETHQAGGYPFLDVFLTMKVSRVRFFASYNNLLQGLGPWDRNYVTAYPYPLKGRYVRVGLVWTFYD
ncbi:MAG: putative porin [Bacteroidales bacterium]